ncbi:hypothetical protein HLB23_01835 [Nocardia uniformis]|uniref:Uncharacterized protein n=1 Tax=Nocardia uniformis TaxID=53432 RepID=A0A849BPJ4_9NOCA|nr:hypothetical protein [Nocardia uniformis]NNH68632.1 hypothetical protein [Nocardia uniformis]
MARLNITMEDWLAQQLRTASDGNVSGYIRKAVLEKMMAEDYRALDAAGVSDGELHEAIYGQGGSSGDA